MGDIVAKGNDLDQAKAAYAGALEFFDQASNEYSRARETFKQDCSVVGKARESYGKLLTTMLRDQIRSAESLFSDDHPDKRRLSSWDTLSMNAGEVDREASCGCELFIKDYYGEGDDIVPISSRPAFRLCSFHASAPEMLAALRWIVYEIEHGPGDKDSIRYRIGGALLEAYMLPMGETDPPPYSDYETDNHSKYQLNDGHASSRKVMIAPTPDRAYEALTEARKKVAELHITCFEEEYHIDFVDIDDVKKILDDLIERTRTP